jgi:hypothetical protein
MPLLDLLENPRYNYFEIFNCAFGFPKAFFICYILMLPMPIQAWQVLTNLPYFKKFAIIL